MEHKMFCYQCQETAGCSGCTQMGVCGKKPEVAAMQDLLVYVSKGLSAVTTQLRKEGTKVSEETNHLITWNLFTTITNANFDNEAIIARIHNTLSVRRTLILQVKDTSGLPEAAFWDIKTKDGSDASDDVLFAKAKEAGVLSTKDEDIRSLRELITYGLKGLSAYSKHANVLLSDDPEIDAFLQRALAATLDDSLTADDLVALTLETGNYGVRGMAMLDTANTGAYGNPEITRVNIGVGKNPGILVSGHDLKDLKMLLEQTEGKGINIYTHGEMLPAHAYPELRKYSHLKGNFGTAWQNQQKEFANLPAPILFTTNCIMPPKESYADRVFTTGVVAYPGMQHVAGEEKDFGAVIEKAIELGGFSEDKQFAGINGGTKLTTGFGHHTILGAAPQVIEAVKAGKISHFFLVGGCDGARQGRNYYTDFVKEAPKHSIILTLACGKYRFNDLDLGTIEGLPRIMDMGQCNDAFGAVKVALALAEAFECGVNELPLTLVLSWYEQKAVSLLLTLLHLGIKNIYLGPTLPSFVSENVLNYLVENFQISPTSTPEEDLKKILEK